MPLHINTHGWRTSKEEVNKALSVAFDTVKLPSTNQLRSFHPFDP
jgi:hypothetical protein